MTWQDQNKKVVRKVYLVLVTIEEKTMTTRDDMPVCLDTRDVLSLCTQKEDMREALAVAQRHLKLYSDDVPSSVVIDPASR